MAERPILLTPEEAELGSGIPARTIRRWAKDGG